MRTFRDSVTPASICLDGIDGAFGYVNGRFAWTAADFDRFTKAGKQVARIDVNGTAPELAAIVDCETGDIGPAQAPAWIRKRFAFRQDPVVYCSLDMCPALFAATAHGCPTYWLWVAHWTGKPHVPVISLPSNVKMFGCQYLNAGAYDESCIVADDWHPVRRAA